MPGKTVSVFSLLVGTVGATLLTVGMATSYWCKGGTGLWKNCAVNGCLAVQATVVISTVFGIVHALILLLHLAKQVGPDTRKIIMSAFMSALLTVIFGVASIIVYAVRLEAFQPSFYGWSFALTLVGIGIIFLNIFVIVFEGSNQRAAGAYSSI
ncbi:hypothetical protein CHS0354_015271 [Potamilus streckersoni]|uniref:Uncharacterized protein n=1 Tax=Potamilus streckersoni TaxID=2493646 RepID=A0AAE0VJF7_9BIVA|nr:hypothetical protein CHS0354_015271 [Potamilus streckersoni]